MARLSKSDYAKLSKADQAKFKRGQRLSASGYKRLTATGKRTVKQRVGVSYSKPRKRARTSGWGTNRSAPASLPAAKGYTHKFERVNKDTIHLIKTEQWMVVNQSAEDFTTVELPFNLAPSGVGQGNIAKYDLPVLRQLSTTATQYKINKMRISVDTNISQAENGRYYFGILYDADHEVPQGRAGIASLPGMTSVNMWTRGVCAVNKRKLNKAKYYVNPEDDDDSDRFAIPFRYVLMIDHKPSENVKVGDVIGTVTVDYDITLMGLHADSDASSTCYEDPEADITAVPVNTTVLAPDESGFGFGSAQIRAAQQAGIAEATAFRQADSGVVPNGYLRSVFRGVTSGQAECFIHDFRFPGGISAGAAYTVAVQLPPGYTPLGSMGFDFAFENAEAQAKWAAIRQALGVEPIVDAGGAGTQNPMLQTNNTAQRAFQKLLVGTSGKTTRSSGLFETFRIDLTQQEGVALLTVVMDPRKDVGIHDEQVDFRLGLWVNKTADAAALDYYTLRTTYHPKDLERGAGWTDTEIPGTAQVVIGLAEVAVDVFIPEFAPIFNALVSVGEAIWNIFGAYRVNVDAASASADFMFGAIAAGDEDGYAERIGRRAGHLDSVGDPFTVTKKPIGVGESDLELVSKGVFTGRIEVAQVADAPDDLTNWNFDYNKGDGGATIDQHLSDKTQLYGRIVPAAGSVNCHETLNNAPIKRWWLNVRDMQPGERLTLHFASAGAQFHTNDLTVMMYPEQSPENRENLLDATLF